MNTHNQHQYQTPSKESAQYDSFESTNFIGMDSAQIVRPLQTNFTISTNPRLQSPPFHMSQMSQLTTPSHFHGYGHQSSSVQLQPYSDGNSELVLGSIASDNNKENEFEADIVKKIEDQDTKALMNYVHPQGYEIYSNFFNKPRDINTRMNHMKVASELEMPESYDNKIKRATGIDRFEKGRRKIDTMVEFKDNWNEFIKKDLVRVENYCKRQLESSIQRQASINREVENDKKRLELVQDFNSEQLHEYDDAEEWCGYQKFWKETLHGPSAESASDINYFGPFTPNLPFEGATPHPAVDDNNN